MSKCIKQVLGKKKFQKSEGGNVKGLSEKQKQLYISLFINTFLT